jgi:hypothetical protein
MGSRSGAGRLRFSLQPTLEEVFEPDYAPEAPLVRFDAYRAHDRMFGWVRLNASRLTDLLNAHEELLLTDVVLESLEDGRTRSVEEIAIRCSELIAVHASGPRGDEGHRLLTVTNPIAVRSGDYLMGGHLHTLPGSDPIADIGERPMMVPLTDAWIEYRSGGQRIKQVSATIIVNRGRVDWMGVISNDDLSSRTAGLRPAPTEQAHDEAVDS